MREDKTLQEALFLTRNSRVRVTLLEIVNYSPIVGAHFFYIDIHKFIEINFFLIILFKHLSKLGKPS